MEWTWRESDEADEDATNNGRAKRQVKLSSLGFTGFKRKTEEIESSGKGRCKFFQARKLELVRKFQWCVLTWQLVVVESILLKFDLNTRNLLKSSRKSWIMDRNFRGAANAGQVFVMYCKELVGIVSWTWLEWESVLETDGRWWWSCPSLPLYLCSHAAPVIGCY